MLSRTECYAEAIVLYAAVERLAASRYQYRERTIGPGIEELRNAQARIITRCLASRERD